MSTIKLFFICHLLFLRKYLKKFISFKTILKNENWKIYTKFTNQIPKNCLKSDSENNILYIASGWMEAALIDISNLKILRDAGYRTIVICPENFFLKKIFNWAGAYQVISFEEYSSNISWNQVSKIAKSLDVNNPLENTDYQNIKIGNFALSSFYRVTRRGNLNNLSKDELKLFFKCLLLSCVAIESSRKIITNFSPKLIIGSDRGYTPQAELFKLSIDYGIHFITWNVAHKNNLIIFKKYTKSNADVHPFSLSEKSWVKLKQTTNYHLAIEELKKCYEDQSWFKEVGTQVDTKLFNMDELKNRLNINDGRKIACIFPHIFWDATLFWGEDVFDDYQHWFESLITAAAKNRNIIWLIKIHPCNVFKNRRDNFNGEPLETVSIRKCLGNELPENIKIIPPEMKISTISLFKILDFCLTVRGTVGIESAALGVTALTCGTGRYDNKGFTVDFTNQDDYLKTISNLENMAQISNEQITLAQQFLYGTLLGRVFNNPYVTFDYLNNNKAELVSRFTNSFYNGIVPNNNILDYFNNEEEDFLSMDLK